MDKSKKSKDEGVKKVDDLIDKALDNLKNMIDSNTIIGKPIQVGAVSILPISRVSVGFISGGGEAAMNGNKTNFPFSGGTGSGFNIVPVGFICVSDKNVEFLLAESNSNYQKVFETTLNLINKVLTDSQKES